MKKSTRSLLASAVFAFGLMTATQAHATQVRPLTGISWIDDTIHIVAVTCGMGSLTAAKIIDGFLYGIAPEWAAGQEVRETTAFGKMVQQMEKQDELELYGYKGPVRRLMDKYCIIGYLTGSGSCGAF